MRFQTLYVFALYVQLCLASYVPRHNHPPFGEMDTRNPDGRAPLHGIEGEEVIPDEYIVILLPDHTLVQHFHVIRQDLSTLPDFVDLKIGYAATIDKETLEQKVRRDPGIRTVIANRRIPLIRPVSGSDILETKTARLSKHSQHHKRDFTRQTNRVAPYGLRMIAAAGKLPTPVFDGGKYDSIPSAGAGVDVYVLDSGIRISHPLFEGRASNFKGLAPTDPSPYCDLNMDDVLGHGTHVAGTIGAQQFGVAPSANLINVKVLGKNQSSSTIGICRAIVDITVAHTQKKRQANSTLFGFRGSIINMSFGRTHSSDPFYHCFYAAFQAGITLIAAAGNYNTDSANLYPCATAWVICVGAVDHNYARANFSNYGTVVGINAPGKDIVSLGLYGNDSTEIKSGTSMASPHVAGTAAIFASGLADTSVARYIILNCLQGICSDLAHFQYNRFINTGIHSPDKKPNQPFRYGRERQMRSIQTATIETAAPADETSMLFTCPANL